MAMTPGRTSKRAKRNAKLLDLYLDSDPTGVHRMADELAFPWATPLAWARKFGLADIEEILLKHGAAG